MPFRFSLPQMSGPFLLFVFAIHATVNAGTSNSLMDLSTDGKLLACSNRDNGTVTIVDLSTYSVARQFAVGKKPEGVSFVGNSHELAVAIYAEDHVGIWNADTGERVAVVEVFDEPYGVVSDQAGTKLYVTLDFPGRLIVIDVTKRAVVAEYQVGSFLRGLALSESSSHVHVTEYYSGSVITVDAGSGAIVAQSPGKSNDNLARQVVLNPLRPKAYIPHIRSRVTAVHGEGSIFPYVSVVDTPSNENSTREPGKRRRIPMDSFRGALVTANPWECAITPNGRHFFVIFAGTDDMFACDVVDDDYQEITYREYIRVGKNPRAVRTSYDGRSLFVYNALDFEITVYDVETLQKQAQVKVAEPPYDEQHLAGKIFFYSAQQPMASRRWISCSSCHPDGDPDGRTWANPEGLRNTQALAGMAWTHPIHWSADRDEVQDFEHTIRGKLMQGRGLLTGELQPELGPRNGGRSQELDALALYSNSHEFSLSPFAKQGLSPQAERGREIFFSAETECARCHSGPLYTDSRSGAAIVRHDVGTGGDPAEKLGPEFDTPTLIGVYRTAPYLHHGKAQTLHEVLREYNPDEQHGRTKHLNETQLNDLVEFLKALPFEDPVAAAVAAGWKKVD